LSKIVDSPWIGRAISGMDQLGGGVRRNLNRQLGLDSLAVSLVPPQPETVSRK
jgi:hypothetical protein